MAKEEWDVHISCGCVFCDIGLKPVKLRRQYVHYDRRYGIAVCHARELQPMSDDSKRVSGPVV